MESMEQGSALPAGRWTHSFEEDQEGVEVYRPESFDFPATRGGRETLEVGPDGNITELAQGPDDRPRPTGVSHQPLGMNRYASFAPDGSAPDTAFEVVEADSNVLKIRRPQ